MVRFLRPPRSDFGLGILDFGLINFDASARPSKIQNPKIQNRTRLVAQLAEQRPFKPRGEGSNPSGPTNDDHWPVAQLAERLTLNQKVEGSNPSGPSMAGQALARQTLVNVVRVWEDLLRIEDRGWMIEDRKGARKNALSSIFDPPSSIFTPPPTHPNAHTPTHNGDSSKRSKAGRFA